MLGLLAVFWVGALVGAEDFRADESGYREVARPFFRTYCEGCHGAEKQKGEFRVDDALPNQFGDRAVRARWAEVVNVLNGHEMPPEKEKQPTAQEVARVVDWVTAEAVRAELFKRDTRTVLRRMNRDEYANTVRDLLGVEADVSALPVDAPSGGFDNNGRALTISPMHLEIYMELAGKVLDRALVTGERPESLRWRFEPEVGSGDSSRVRYDAKNNAIVHGGKNVKEGGVTLMHHESWDRNPNARDFAMYHEGEYVVRVRAGGTVPGRDAVVASARRALERRIAETEGRGKTDEARRQRERLEKELEHFQTDRMYDYGPPRLKLVHTSGGQPRVVAEWDVDAPAGEPRVYEFRVRCTKERMGLTLEYAYAIPKVLENFWMQGHDDFARPVVHLDWFEIEGPMAPEWPPASHVQLLGKEIPTVEKERDAARAVLEHFMPRAYRRPVDASEIDRKLALFDAVRAGRGGYVEAMKASLTGVLASPEFLYLSERAGEGDGSAVRRLSDHELAVRLSYFLWGSMPDAELRALADRGGLREAEALGKQVDRMLLDSRVGALGKSFAAQWLGLREVGANPPASDLYPQYDRHLQQSFVGESLAFFDEVLRGNRSVLSFLSSEFVTVNERLARFYGIDGVRGDAFRVVPAAAHRGGVMTQGAVLTITSNGTRTSPVKRGVWLLKNLLGIDPGLPVANAGEIAPKVPGVDKATVRQRLSIHRELPQCARCHDRIDPLGFALENFNAAGEWREQEGFGYKGRIDRNDPKIDASSQLPDGTVVEGADGLRAALMARQDLFLNCLSSKLFTYALGREMGLADRPMIQRAVDRVKGGDMTLRSLIKEVVESDAFGTK
jgi:mono/diheme cytochrome c family protein